MLLPKCLCGSPNYNTGTIHEIPILTCNKCGVVRQVVRMDLSRYAEYYTDRYHEDVYTHTLAHDYDVAQKRIRQYVGILTGKVLDLGAGNFSFVDACAKAGYSAEGQDLAAKYTDHPLAHTGEFRSLNFPTDAYNTVTAHDVIEHVPDIVAFVAEAFRVTAQHGCFIVDFPDFWHPAGKHHWKIIEHLWMLDAPQIEKILRSVGFEIEKVFKPIPSKLVFVARKPEQKRTSIMVPPGIGDSYWSIVKMQSFIDRQGIGLPDVYIQCPDDRKRSEEFVARFPFLHCAGYREMPVTDPVFHEAYILDQRNIFENVKGCDYFLAFNGGLRAGKSMADLMPELACNWDLPMFVPLAEKAARAQYVSDFGEYYVAYFVPHGMYRTWLMEFKPSQVFDTLKCIEETTGRKIVFVGSEWDRRGLAEQFLKHNSTFIDLTGQTNMDQLFGLLKGAQGVIGYPSGLTMMAAHFKVPTTMLWSRYFHEGFHTHAVRPDAPDYRIVRTYEDPDPCKIAAQFTGCPVRNFSLSAVAAGMDAEYSADAVIQDRASGPFGEFLRWDKSLLEQKSILALSKGDYHVETVLHGVGFRGDVSTRHLDPHGSTDIPGSYDSIVCIHCLEYMRNSAISDYSWKIWGALKPGGLLYFMVQLDAPKPNDRFVFQRSATSAWWMNLFKAVGIVPIKHEAPDWKPYFFIGRKAR